MTPRGWMGSSPKKADGGLPLGGPADPYLHDAPETLAWHAKLITVSASFAVSFELRFFRNSLQAEEQAQILVGLKLQCLGTSELRRKNHSSRKNQQENSF